MYDMLWQSGPFGRENLCCPKKHLKTPKIMDKFSGMLTLEGAGGQPVTPGQNFLDPVLVAQSWVSATK